VANICKVERHHLALSVLKRPARLIGATRPDSLMKWLPSGLVILELGHWSSLAITQT
jgi:hypothetical protein